MHEKTPNQTDLYYFYSMSETKQDLLLAINAILRKCQTHASTELQFVDEVFKSQSLSSRGESALNQTISCGSADPLWYFQPQVHSACAQWNANFSQECHAHTFQSMQLTCFIIAPFQKQCVLSSLQTETDQHKHHDKFRNNNRHYFYIHSVSSETEESNEEHRKHHSS